MTSRQPTLGEGGVWRGEEPSAWLVSPRGVRISSRGVSHKYTAHKCGRPPGGPHSVTRLCRPRLYETGCHTEWLSSLTSFGEYFSVTAFTPCV